MSEIQVKLNNETYVPARWVFFLLGVVFSFVLGIFERRISAIEQDRTVSKKDNQLFQIQVIKDLSSIKTKLNIKTEKNEE